jgi:hypothetical protein
MVPQVMETYFQLLLVGGLYTGCSLRRLSPAISINLSLSLSLGLSKFGVRHQIFSLTSETCNNKHV